MFASYSPEQENTSGARWNCAGIPAIYTSLSRDVVIAEAEYQISMQPRRPKARRTIYKIGIRLSNVIEISSNADLTALGLNDRALADADAELCRRIGSS